MEIQCTEEIQRYSLLCAFIREAVTSVENSQVIDVLDVALLEVGGDVELLTQEVKGVERLSLGFRDGRDAMPPWQLPEAHEVPPSILQCHAIGGRSLCRLEVQKRP